ncbi:response regulator [Segetibacter sp. 3557_3]|uniref:response regulator n=1 Tax=Segetibacter sp. 3557_3 TaxID=2547429 RepID=UPI0010587045|nr:response regulator [Segetibacter sp. 3557_3]TDH28811.1 response regulator [Segetibacter sp. 3557_3]
MIKKVICIDDDQITLTLCDLVIKKAKFADAVATSKHGKEGLNYFSAFFQKKDKIEISEAPQLIFLDLNMPVMNGWDFLEEYLMKYADRLPDVKVVIISSTVNPEDFSRANRYDIVIDFISKPLTVEGLEDLMQNDHLSHYFTPDPTDTN